MTPTGSLLMRTFVSLQGVVQLGVPFCLWEKKGKVRQLQATEGFSNAHVAMNRICRCTPHVINLSNGQSLCRIPLVFFVSSHILLLRHQLFRLRKTDSSPTPPLLLL